MNKFFPLQSFDSCFNPFIAISPLFRRIVLVYFIGWRFLPLFAELGTAITYISFPYIISVSLQLVIQSILLLPFLRRSFGGTPIGWLHPLIFPTLFSLALSLLKQPGSIFEPFFIFSSDNSFYHPLIGDWNQEAISMTQLTSSVIALLAILSSYIGFITFKYRISLKLKLPSRRNYRFFFLAIFCFLVAIFYLYSQGGILSQLQGLAFGRFGTRANSGYAFVVVSFLPLLLVFWYLYNPKIIFNKFFILIYGGACVLQFLVSGSRSGLFEPIALLLIAHCLINQKMNIFRFIFVALIAISLLGTLGDVRRSGLSGEASFDALLNFNLGESFEKSAEEVKKRDLGTNISVSAFVPDQVDHLWGSSYVSSLAFWIPRTIWPGKPRGIGAHTAAIIYRGVPIEGYGGAGFPLSAPYEAFWNFGWLGVISIFYLFGALQKLITNLFLSYPSNSIIQIILLLTIFQFSSPSTVSMVTFQQNIVLILFVAFTVKLTTPNSS